MSRRSRIGGLVLAAGFALLGNPPCGPIPGGALEGTVVTEPVTDWSFSDDFSRCLVEVRPEEPHSVTTSCFVHDGALWVPAVMGASKKWTKLAVADPRGRVQVGDRIYPVTFERVDDPAERLAAARAAHRKYQGDEPPDDLEIDDDRWYFRLTSRQDPAP